MKEIEKLKARIRPVLKKYGIQKAAIFGSVLQDPSGANDLDLLVKIEKRISMLEFIEIQHELEDELNMKVDLVEYDTIKPALREDILSDEEPVL